MNFADSKRLKNLLEKNGWTITYKMDEASVIFAIGCSVRKHAENKVFSFIDGCKNIKGKGRVVGLLGCTANIYNKSIFKNHPHVDIVCGNNYFNLLPEKIESAFKGEKIILTGEKEDPFISGTYCDNNISVDIPITKGCENFCSYCIVPYARGRLQSRYPDDIINEIKNLSDSGVKYVTLLGQNVNEYGNDLNIQYGFADLLKDISKIDGILRISFMTSHPRDTTDKVLNFMAENEKIMKYLHIPVQSGSNKILKMMNRKYTREEYMTLIKKARTLIPDISISSDIMVGFPGETEKDFLETYNLIEEICYDKLYIFKYSQRPFTKSADLPEPVSEDEKEKRHEMILTLQKKISGEISNRYINKHTKVLVEKLNKNGSLEGKNINNKTVDFNGGNDLIGKIVNVKIEKYCRGCYFGILQK